MNRTKKNLRVVDNGSRDAQNMKNFYDENWVKKISIRSPNKLSNMRGGVFLIEIELIFKATN